MFQVFDDLCEGSKDKIQGFLNFFLSCYFLQGEDIITFQGMSLD